MVFSRLLVVVNQFDVDGIRSIKTENNAPICPDRDRPKPLQVAFKRMQTITWEIKRLRMSRPIETGKNILNSTYLIRPYPPLIAILIQPFQTPMLKTPDH